MCTHYYPYVIALRTLCRSSFPWALSAPSSILQIRTRNETRVRATPRWRKHIRAIMAILSYIPESFTLRLPYCEHTDRARCRCFGMPLSIYMSECVFIHACCNGVGGTNSVRYTPLGRDVVRRSRFRTEGEHALTACVWLAHKFW